MRFLRSDADRAIVGMTGPHGDTANRLHRRVRQGNRIRPQRQRLDEIRRFAQATGDHQ